MFCEINLDNNRGEEISVPGWMLFGKLLGKS